MPINDVENANLAPGLAGRFSVIASWSSLPPRIIQAILSMVTMLQDD
jgi:hypothetical protein